MDVFTAVADPTRRWILECLRTSGPQSISDLTKPLRITRQAVTKHLKHLIEAGLVMERPVGRKRMHHLQAAPLQEVDEWLEPYSKAWDERLDRLRTYLDEESSDGGEQ